MKAVILAAGRGTRLGNLTEETPKPLMRVGRKCLIEYNISNLPKKVTGIIVIVGYMKEKIIQQLGQEFNGRKITYIEQKKLLGTGHAIHLCKDLLKEKFLVMMGDDIYRSGDMEKCIQYENCIMVKKIKEKTTAAKVIIDRNGHLRDIIEGVSEKNITINTGLYVLQPYFFEYKLVPIKNGKEFGLPQTIVKMSVDHKVTVEQTSFSVHINTIEELEAARKMISKNQNLS